MTRILFTSLLFIVSLVLWGQNPPTILRSTVPPDITESYRANPRFYEIMSAFPHNNSFYMYNFEDVRKKARNDPEYMVILGDHYRIGRSTPMDMKRAMREYERAASKGYAKANHRIAYMYADGLGLPKDREKIMEFLKKSADGGYDLAQYDYALVFLNGKFGEARDIRKAYPYLLKASEQGHRLSTELLAMVSYHAAAPNAGIPTGLETALKYYRGAKDTDGERALMQNISSFGGLRYYLRAIPGFLPGVDAALDPTDLKQGIELLEQLERVIHLTGEENFNRYKFEISENILYNNYHKAQGDRIALLGFLISCNNNSKWLHPASSRYIDAAARDFRLTVNFLNTQSLLPYLDEFRSYRQKFQDPDKPVVADRIYVALFFPDMNADLRKKTAEFFREESWILHNLSGRYIVHFETYEFELNRDHLIFNPDIGKGYLDNLFQRFNAYRPEEADTLSAGFMNNLRAYCIHPLLNVCLYEHLKTVKNLPVEKLNPMMDALLLAESMYMEDANLYISTLKNDPLLLNISPAEDINIAELADNVSALMRKAGADRIKRLCNSLQTRPEYVIRELSSLKYYEIAEMNVSPNDIATRNLEFLAWSGSINIRNISFSDPNGVVFIPEVIPVFAHIENPCNPSEKQLCHVLNNETETFATWRCEIFNNLDQSVSIRILLQPISEYSEIQKYMNPWQEVEIRKTWHSEWFTLEPGGAQQISFSIDSADTGKFWQPVIMVQDQQFFIPFIRRGE